MATIGTRLLKISVGGTDYTAQVSSAKITSAPSDADFITFADTAAGGARLYNLEFTASQDLATASLWDKVWTAAGTSVVILLKPYGNTAASATQPHYSANATVKEPDGDLIGGDADASTTAAFTFSAVWPLDAKPTKVIV